MVSLDFQASLKMLVHNEIVASPCTYGGVARKMHMSEHDLRCTLDVLSPGNVDLLADVMATFGKRFVAYAVPD